ncbi:nucleotide-binding protein [Mesorhizobium sp. M0050]|uniref:TIR domain-containing protein n=1 Tax=Mesorhizobium sp. M0050 TaxID=2956861 RepID=UPI00333CCDEE
MRERFMGEEGRRLRFETLARQKIVAGNEQLAADMADLVELRDIAPGEMLIEQNADDNDVYFILAGSVGLTINGRQIATRGAGEHVGEMSAIEPTQRRSATVIGLDPSVVARLTEQQFSELGQTYPQVYRYIARELANRLLQRNKHIGVYREKVRVFIISSAEALEVARVIQNALSHNFIVILWTDGVFKIAHYTLQSLEDAIDASDFAIAVAHADDVTESRGKNWPSPRDNVIFELGLFMGRLGRTRAILMEPREEKVKLPSDLAGITTIAYRFEKGSDAAALMAPACNVLRDHINALGPYNG